MRRTLTEVGSEVSFGAPKSSASVRTLILPAPLLAELASHVERYQLDGGELLFTDRGGRPLRRFRFRNPPEDGTYRSLGITRTPVRGSHGG